MQTLRQPLITDTKQPYVVSDFRVNDFLLHSHDELELLTLLSGELAYTVDGERYVLHPGDVVLVAPNLIHGVHVLSESEPARGLLIECGYALYGDDYQLLRGKTFDSPVRRIFPADCPLSAQLGEPLRVLLREAERIGSGKPGMAESVAIRGALCELFVILVRKLPMRPIADSHVSQTQRLRWSTVFDYIAAHYREQIHIEQAASLAGYSVYHFSRVFREYTGVPFHRYLNRYRIERASLLLSDPTLAVTQVAEQSGFESIKTFNRVFRQETGFCPSEFRIRQRTAAAEEGN